MIEAIQGYDPFWAFTYQQVKVLSGMINVIFLENLSPLDISSAGGTWK